MALLRRSDYPEYDRDFLAYYRARAGHLRRTAYLLVGDWHLAEDLTQATFIKLYQRWRRIERHDVLDQYARKVLLRVLRTALARIPERRRAVLVLRFWVDLSVEQVADILGCSAGSVRGGPAHRGVQGVPERGHRGGPGAPSRFRSGQCGRWLALRGGAASSAGPRRALTNP